MSNSLEERLQIHSNAFDGLLSLIPAKYYYDESTQDQWQQKKKTKDELKQHKRDKLDPESNDFEGKLSAKEVMDNKAKTAKPVKMPKKLEKPQKEESEEEIEIPDMDVDKDEEEEQKKNDEDSIQIEFDDDGNEIGSDTPEPIKTPEEPIKPIETKENKPDLKDRKKKPLSEEEAKKKQENLKALREKLASKISNLKEKRKAPGSKGNGAPKSREQILEERKKKAEIRKQEKLKRKHEEIESGSDEESEEENDDKEVDEDGNVVFGNIAFNDGSRMTSDLNSLRSGTDNKRKKGPANKDIKAHIARLEKQKQKMAKLSPEDQKAQQEKEKWQRLMNQAEGIKVKDDEKLLKKALKRKERTKLRSEIEWKERKQVVKDTMAARAKKREENLRLKQENKGKKHKHQVKLRKFTGIVKKQKGKKPDGQNGKKRAGFEGSAKSKKK